MEGTRNGRQESTLRSGRIISVDEDEVNQMWMIKDAGRE